MDLAERTDREELMDSPLCGGEDLRGALAFLELTNRCFGGRRAVLKHLRNFSRSWQRSEPVRILDAGCGSADIDLAIADWAEESGFAVSIVGLERSPEIARLAARNAAGCKAVRIVEGDVFSLPAGLERFDYAIGCLFLHHIPPQSLGAALKILDGVADRGLIFSDLERSRRALWAVRLLALAAGNRVVRNDGPLSVRRAFQPRELESLARDQGLGYLKAANEPFFRVSLAGEKPHHG